ncbi:hypothetical protein BKA61DRAFT_568394 [Leptodontidium sp. MPI-SDFR-AT-0119]|nr:hypothetical protein BKA61DRAFT_568394 [Leptodontidium sp. MPI-SDFR-AT-0119]
MHAVGSNLQNVQSGVKYPQVLLTPLATNQIKEAIDIRCLLPERSLARGYTVVPHLAAPNLKRSQSPFFQPLLLRLDLNNNAALPPKQDNRYDPCFTAGVPWCMEGCLRVNYNTPTLLPTCHDSRIEALASMSAEFGNNLGGGKKVYLNFDKDGLAFPDTDAASMFFGQSTPANSVTQGSINGSKGAGNIAPAPAKTFTPVVEALTWKAAKERLFVLENGPRPPKRTYKPRAPKKTTEDAAAVAAGISELSSNIDELAQSDDETEEEI